MRLHRMGLGLLALHGGVLLVLAGTACGDDAGKPGGGKPKPAMDAATDGQVADAASDGHAHDAGHRPTMEAYDATADGASGAADAGDAGHSGSDASTTGGIKTSKTIGSSGGTITAPGVKLEIPADALSTSTTIIIEQLDDGTPPGLKAYSPRFKFSPDGLTFATPATVTIDFTGDSPTTSVYWSRQDTTTGDWDQLASTIDGNTVSAPVSHFSEGFAGDVGGVCTRDDQCRMGVPNSQGWRCCGTGDIKNCVNTEHDEENCSGCELRCKVGSYCQRLGLASATCETCLKPNAGCQENDQCCTGFCDIGGTNHCL